LSSKYNEEIVAYFTHDALILCPYCTEKADRESNKLFGLNRNALSEFMAARFKDEGEFYDVGIEFYPCDMCGGEIE